MSRVLGSILTKLFCISRILSSGVSAIDCGLSCFVRFLLFGLTGATGLFRLRDGAAGSWLYTRTLGIGVVTELTVLVLKSLRIVLANELPNSPNDSSIASGGNGLVGLLLFLVRSSVVRLIPSNNTLQSDRNGSLSDIRWSNLSRSPSGSSGLSRKP